MKISKVLEKKSENHFIHYYVIGMPWPFKNRDMFMESKGTFKPAAKTAFITNRSIQKKGIRPCKKCLRMVSLSSSWQLSENSNGTVTITYISHFDPGGNLPAFVVNYLSRDKSYQTLKALYKMALKQKIHKNPLTR